MVDLNVADLIVNSVGHVCLVCLLLLIGLRVFTVLLGLHCWVIWFLVYCFGFVVFVV